MTRTEFIKEIEYLKDCKGIPGTSFENLGRSTFDKIVNILKNEKNILTHFHIPKGNPEAVEQLKARHLEIFGIPINEEIVSFFTCFNGFEFRYVNIDAIWKSFCEDDIFDWDDAGFNPKEVRFEDLKKEEFEDVLDDFQGTYVNISGNLFEPDFGFNQLSDSKKTGIQFYGDSAEFEDYGIKSFIPMATIFLDNENKVYGTEALYYLNFHHSFRQLGYGKIDGKISLFKIDDAGADILELREDFCIHMKKNLIRLD